MELVLIIVRFLQVELQIKLEEVVAVVVAESTPTTVFNARAQPSLCWRHLSKKDRSGVLTEVDVEEEDLEDIIFFFFEKVTKKKNVRFFFMFYFVCLL